MEITSNFPITKEQGYWIVSLGGVKVSEKKAVDLFLTGELLKIQEVQTTCGCTSSEKTENSVKLTFKAGQSKGSFSKTTIIKYKEGGKPYSTEVKLKGTII